MIPGHPAGENIVVDTNILSYIFKDDTRGPSYARLIAPYMGIISFQTVAELSEWPLKNRWGARKTQELFKYLALFKVMHSTPSLCAQWAALRVSAMRSGQPIAVADAWIAATALALKCPLVTHNVADYRGIEKLQVISETHA